MKNPRRDGPPAIANGIDEISPIWRTAPVRSRCAPRCGR